MKCLRKIFNNPTNTLMKNMKVNLKQLMGLMLVMLLALQCSSEGFSSGTSSGRRLRAPNMRRKTTQGGVSGFGVRSSQTDDFSSNASQTSKKRTIKSTGGSSLLPESFDVEQDDVKQSRSAPQKVLSAEGLAVKDELKVEFGEGHGETTDEALKEAMRDVLQKVVGVYVDSDFRMNNDEIIRDEIITYSNGFIDHYKKMDEEDDKNGRGKVVTIKAWVKMRDFVNRVKKIAPSQTVKVDGVLLDSDVGNKIRAEALLKRTLSELNPAMDLLEVELVENIRPEVQGANDDFVTLRYVFQVRYSKKRFYQEFIPRLSGVLDQISATSHRDRDMTLIVKKVGVFPALSIDRVGGEGWEERQVSGFWLEPKNYWYGGLSYETPKPVSCVSAIVKVTRGGAAIVREWNLSERLTSVYNSCRADFYERSRKVLCVLKLMDANGNLLTQSSCRIVDGCFLPEWSVDFDHVETGVDFIPFIRSWGSDIVDKRTDNGYSKGVGWLDRYVGCIDIAVDREDVSKIKSAEIKLETTNKGE